LYTLNSQYGIAFDDMILVVEEANTCRAFWDPAVLQEMAPTQPSHDKVQDPKKQATLLDHDDPAANHGNMLDVFDGIVELKGLIVLFTANDISKFHPALVRVGRIQGDARTFFGPLSSSDVSRYFEKRFGRAPAIKLRDDFVATMAEVLDACDRAGDDDADGAECRLHELSSACPGI
jgi:hypothetical protein